MLSKETQDLARRLLELEANVGETSVLESAFVRVSEKLRGTLCTVVGVDIYRLLLSRALTLARAKAPSLKTVAVAQDGSLQRVGEFDSQSGENDAGVNLISQLLGLFLALLGTPLTMRLLQDVSPHLEVELSLDPTLLIENILHEAGELTEVSKRLESLADQHSSMGNALLSISGNVRNTATVLEVLTVVADESSDSSDKLKKPEPKQFLM